MNETEDTKHPIDLNRLYESVIRCLEETHEQEEGITYKDIIHVLARVLAVKCVETMTEREVHDLKNNVVCYVGNAFINHINTLLDIKRLSVQDDTNERIQS